jgi:histidyl-tRNA synthetase
LARGQAYYTGIVFEIFDTNEENSRALCGGGRYDNLLEIFDVEPIPTVGFGMGDIALLDFIKTHKIGLFSE